MPGPLPTCFNLLNTDYFNNLIAQITALGNAADLPDIDTAAIQAEMQALVDKVFADLSTLESTVTSQITYINLINPLLTAPTDLGELVTWAGNFVLFLEQLVKPYLNLIAMLAQLPAQITALTAAIVAAATKLGITITIPSITIGCQI